MTEEKKTPMMQQWESCKKQAKDAILLFRLGDFYEAFHEDAALLANALDLTLTKRHEIPMSGIPWHTAEGYIDKLVAKGFRVAIAEQMQNPKDVKGIVERKIVRVVTPGTLTNAVQKYQNYIVAISQLGTFFGLASLEHTTGEFKVIEFEKIEELIDEICRLKPSELLLTKKFKEKYSNVLNRFEEVFSLSEEYFFEHEKASFFLLHHFKVSHLDGFGLKGKVASINAAGALLCYLKEELNLSLDHIAKVLPYSNENFLFIDPASERNLELIDPLFKETSKFTLLHLIDKSLTPMGGRKIREWLKKPLVSVPEIHKRQEGVEAFILSPREVASLVAHLSNIRDLERLMMKISSNLATPKDVAALLFSLEQIEPIKENLHRYKEPIIFAIVENLADLSSLTLKLKRALVEEPPLRIGEGSIFQDGFNALLDDLKEKRRKGKNWLSDYQVKLKEESGIKTLKIGYTKVFGYYIEISQAQAKNVPSYFQKKQTLSNGERFTTDALKEYESDLLNGEEKILVLEKELFESLRLEIIQFIGQIFDTALAIAQLDALISLAKTAKDHHFSRPLVDNSDAIEIEGGKHPIVDSVLPFGQFIPNDTSLSDKTQLMLITGPNMAGKSTYIRQVALIVILAQMGSFVPASKARIGVVDKIFTRIGASDDLSRGQSTFMVEMSETANILNNATSRSLVILDEIGRGTSTYDGVAIAMAVAEFLLGTTGCKTLFATHYVELSHLEKRFSTVANYHALVEERKEGIVFLHKMGIGVAPRSYGIHVARLAGLPTAVLSRAQTILSRLEKVKEHKEEKKEEQLLLFS